MIGTLALFVSERLPRQWAEKDELDKKMNQAIPSELIKKLQPTHDEKIGVIVSL